MRDLGIIIFVAVALTILIGGAVIDRYISAQVEIECIKARGSISAYNGRCVLP